MTISSDSFAENEDILQGSESDESSIRIKDGACDSAHLARVAVTLELLPREASHDGKDKPSVSVRFTVKAHQGMDKSSDSAQISSLCLLLMLR